MFNNYNLFKYGKCVTGQRRMSLKDVKKGVDNEERKHKNMKERAKDN